jgi:hypothetical protein
MPTRPCSSEPKQIAQTLFLGASVASYSTNIGWGSQPSQITVNLIEDEVAPKCLPNTNGNPTGQTYNQFVASSHGSTDDHYHTCAGASNIDCYIDKYTGAAATSTTPVENRILPGKVYYNLDSTTGTLKSRYWKKPDPGFFGNSTKIDRAGADQTAGTITYKYDIIDTPVYFKMGNFTFGGFVQSWSRNLNSGGKQYSVIINGPSAILKSCYVIVDKFTGAIFSRNTNSYYGTPKNYTKVNSDVTYDSTLLQRGILPNVFNAYGFLESFGINSFGGSGKNENGISINYILGALSVLTSVAPGTSQTLWATGTVLPRSAFSPFGRIVSKCMAKDKADTELYDNITNGFSSFGVIPPQPANMGAPNTEGRDRCQFVLDLNDLIYSDTNRTIKRLPDDIRITGPVMSIMDLIDTVAEKTGQDIFIEMVPTIFNSVVTHVIKVKTISRLQQPRPNIIENTIKKMECEGYYISSNSFGKEKNETPARAMIIGGQQQRLYQVKSYRLAYSQSNFIYNPKTGSFVNYRVYNQPVTTASSLAPFNNANQYGHGKIKPANFCTTRNKPLTDYLNSDYDFSYHDIVNDEDKIVGASATFTSGDSTWADTNETGSGLNCIHGNYASTIKLRPNNAPTASEDRWIPLYMDTICPFFGFVNDDTATISVNSTNSDTNTDQRRIRPVWLDAWTGQINVVINVSELPELNVSLTKASLGSSFTLPYSNTRSIPGGQKIFNSTGELSSLPNTEYFYITESEIRAALAGFDNFLVYCLSKTYKPDLIEMVRRAYFLQTKNKLTGLGVSAAEADSIAHKETDWYWKLMGGNIGGDSLYPVPISPDKSDGSQYIQEKALQDLKLLHKFVSEVGKHYGKKYMVTAWNLQAYKDESLFGAAFSTTQGYGYIFSGDGKLTYNYTPTNDGAWEEYGNIIDDSIVVGSPEWYSITDEQGKIKPLLGYNNNYNFDHVRYAKCVTANNANFRNVNNEWNQSKANPYFSFNTWLTLQEAKRTNCSDTYVFPSLDTSSLSSSDYIVVNQKGQQTATHSIVPRNAGGSFGTITLSNELRSYNAWGEELKTRNSDGAAVPLPKSKIYLPTTVEEDYVFLDPVNREYAKILIDSPGLNLYLSSEENAKDPNRTVIANVAAEDLIVYLKTHSVYDYEWIRFMLSYIVPMSPTQTILGGDILYGTLAASSNTTANNVELAPKAAHPFFAAIPIKSNVCVYGPWTNYPNILGTAIFPTASSFDQSTSLPPTCTVSTFSTTADAAGKAVNNMITATEIEVQDDFVPWNYGGMYNLDIAAFKEIETKVNYQTIIETAQVEMPGLPLFNLGGSFVYANINLNYQTLTTGTFAYTQTTYNPSVLVDLTYAGGTMVYNPNSTSDVTFAYAVIDLKQNTGYTEGPIISSIQTSIGQQGISTTYTFRTYTRKIGLFNKEENDRLKKLAKINMQRNKQIANLSVQMQNIKQQQLKFMTDERLNKAEFGSGDLSSKLYGWSPSMVIIAQARPYIEEPLRTPKYIEDFTLNSNPGGLGTQPGTPTNWNVPHGSDDGDSSSEKQGFLTTSNNDTFLKSTGRITSTVQLYERKEVNGQLDKDYGMQSAMSLDGLLSPISFYPTDKNATFNYSLHDTARCPFCKGTKIRKIELVHYVSDGTKSKGIIDITCDKCTYLNKKLNAVLNVENSDVPINLITLNPIVVPKGEFKNSNSQNYSGNHPDNLHGDLSNVGGYSGKTRYFRDRLRHCIEIVARGSVPQSKAGYALETSRNVNEASSNITTDKYNLDYHHQDIMLSHMRSKYGDNINNTLVHETNQRFIGLRGPLVLHSWGYDQDGYPAPNASDEPYEFDSYGRPMRFKIKINRGTTPKKYKSLNIGDAFSLSAANTEPIYAKTFNRQYIPSTVSDNTDVYPVEVTNDLRVNGGFDPAQGYTGDIIGKTQKWNGSRWSDKVVTNDFYLNWAERPDLWKVGPIDLVWDEERKVWAGGSGGEELMPPYVMTNSNDISSLDDFLKKRKKKKASYQHIYATLEEDLIKQTDFDETYATRAFIDDIEYSKDPLLSGYRRLIYIKDKCGYTAPRGTKLLCRYNRITGFYEPISKPVIMAKGSIASSNKATIELHYVQGRRSSTVPTVLMDYTNPMAFTTNTGSVGMFTFINGMWTLISIK